MTETIWMTRKEAAKHVQVSLRQFNRLGLPRVMLGPMTPRYERAMLDDYLRRLAETPGTRRRMGGLSGPPIVLRQTPADGEEIIKQWDAKLLKLQRRKRSNTGRA